MSSAPSLLLALVILSSCGADNPRVVETSAPTAASVGTAAGTAPDTSATSASTSPASATSDLPRGPTGVDTLVVSLRTTADFDLDAMAMAAQAVPAVLGVESSRVSTSTEGQELVVTVVGVSDAETTEIVVRLSRPDQILLRPVLQCQLLESADGSPPPTAPPSDPTGQQFLPDGSGLWCLVGPALSQIGVFAADAQAELSAQGNWTVLVSLAPGAGEVAFNAAANECFTQSAACPTGQLAIVLGSDILTAPVVNVPSFDGSLEISGSFDQAAAEGLAQRLRTYSAFWGFELDSTRTVTP